MTDEEAASLRARLLDSQDELGHMRAALEVVAAHLKETQETLELVRVALDRASIVLLRDGRD